SFCDSFHESRNAGVTDSTVPMKTTFADDASRHGENRASHLQVAPAVAIDSSANNARMLSSYCRPPGLQKRAKPAALCISPKSVGRPAPRRASFIPECCPGIDARRAASRTVTCQERCCEQNGRRGCHDRCVIGLHLEEKGLHQ